jgi:hypothetical protein
LGQLLQLLLQLLRWVRYCCWPSLLLRLHLLQLLLPLAVHARS